MALERIGIIGLGLLGKGITASMLAGGLKVTIYDQSQTVRDEIQPYLNDVMTEIAEHRPAASANCLNWRTNFQWAATLKDFRDCDLIIESVSEVLAIKYELLARLETIVGPDVPLASNTSALPITELQRGLIHPQRVLGMHFAEPAFATRFLELIGGEQTSPAVLEEVSAFARSLGKEPCIVSDLPGFIVNRLGYAMYREAMHLLATGVADAATIDRAYRNAAGLWASFCGPFRWIDLTGGAALYARAMTHVMPELASGSSVPGALSHQAQLDAQSVATDGDQATTGFYGETQAQKQAWLELLHRQAWEIEALRTRMDEAMKNAGVVEASTSAVSISLP